jgi:hypothetical protein
MLYRLLLFLLVLNSICYAQVSSLVFNGERTSEYPYTGRLVDKEGYCTATALPGSSCIITATHCIEDNQIFELNNEEYSVVDYVGFKRGDYYADVMLAKLDRSVPLLDSGAFRLSQDDEFLNYGDNVVIVGYGLNGYGKSRVAKRRGTMYFSHYRFNNPLGLFFRSTTMQLFPFNNRDLLSAVCVGDSGGPVFYGNTLVGINSAGYSIKPPKIACVRQRKRRIRWSQIANRKALESISKKVGLKGKYIYSYKVARNYCKSLGRQWRLPTAQEIQRKGSSHYFWVRDKKRSNLKPAMRGKDQKLLYIEKWATACGRQTESEVVSVAHYREIIGVGIDLLNCYN